MSECKDCPNMIGDNYERDCCFPDCVGWHIEKNLKPIPDRRFDYDFWHDDYDGDNGLCGNARSVIDAMEMIAEIIKNNKPPTLDNKNAEKSDE